MALSSRRTGRSRFTLLVLVLASITLLTLDFRDTGPVQGLRDGAAAVFDPVRDATDGITEPIGNAWDGIFGYDDLKDENERLRKRIDELEARGHRGRRGQPRERRAAGAARAGPRPPTSRP